MIRDKMTGSDQLIACSAPAEAADTDRLGGLYSSSPLLLSHIVVASLFSGDRWQRCRTRRPTQKKKYRRMPARVLWCFEPELQQQE